MKWDLSSIYPSIENINQDINYIKQKIQKLNDLLNTQSNILEIIKNYEDLIERNRKLQAYIACVISTNSQDEQAQKIKGILYQLNSNIHLLILDIEKKVSKEKTQLPDDYNYFIEQLKENSNHRMEKQEEELYSKLFITSSSEWKSLYHELISNIKVDFQGEIISISKLRNYYNNPDRTLREKAYKKEIEIFKEYEYIFSRILNSIKWDSIVTSQKRKFNTVLEESLFHNKIDKEILDVVFSVTFENINTIKRYFYKKAQLLNLDKLEWYDLSAPIIKENMNYFSIDQAQKIILDNFANFSEDMYNMASLAFKNNWIDYEPRIGKTDGGFCIYVHKNESRILVNYDNSVKSLLTLAHELGHSYHNWVMSENSPVYRTSPLILAETASILAETIIRKNTLEKADKYLKINILDGYLYTISIVVIDILSRFLFEDKIINIRKERLITPSEFCQIMLDSQREVYQDSINSFHPYMWANKPHYYSSNYYNYPYLLGLLIGLSLYNLYTKGNLDKKSYRELLKNTAKNKPEKIMNSIGINIREPDFWQEAFESIKQDIEEFENL